MLKRLFDWRVGCTPQQLLDFEAALTPACQDSISNTTLGKRYNGRYHCALLNQKTLLTAVQINDTSAVFISLYRHGTIGEVFARKLAKCNGSMPVKTLDAEHHKVFLTLKKRGIVFLHDEHVCMPAEFVLMLKKKKQAQAWLSLCANLPKILLQKIITPDDLGFVANGAPMHYEIAAALLCQGLLALASDDSQKVLDEKDRDLLCHLDMQGAVSSIMMLQRFCPDAMDARQIHARLPSPYSGSGIKNKSAMESALEEHFPKRLKKLIRLGLIGLIIKNHNQSSTQVILSEEGRVFLTPLMNGACEHIAMQEKHAWNAPHCEVGVASPWIHEHDLWRIWLALHFMPLHRTGQGHFYKAAMKKLASILHLDQEFPLNNSISCLLTLNFLNEEDEGVLPASINWAVWSERQFNLTINWAKSDSERHMVAALLLELPVNQWLKLEHVTAWLNAKSKNNALLSRAPWHRLFTQFPNIALHHFDTTGQCIYLLPAFHAVLSGEIVQSGQSPFSSPGWKGSEKSASESGVINAAGDIQLPPEFNHKKLNAFNTFCTLTKVEYQITLRINPEKISRVKCSKSEIKTMRALLESVQSPLPQALTYLFDKQVKLEPVAHIESTSLLIMLLHADDAKRIHALGFSVRQPFPDLPQVMLLEDGIYAHAFIAACQKAGILLETGTPPKFWIEGESCIFRWIHAHKWCAGDWFELCYWSHNGEMKQVIARLEPSYYIVKIRILETKNKRSVLQPYITSINSEDISRLRVLDGTEIKNHGLDKLS